MRLHRRLRGRYRWVFFFGLLGLLLGGAAGYFITTPKYRSVGHIEIEAVVPVGRDDASFELPMFESFVERQATMLRSRSLIEQAIASDAWARYRRVDGGPALGSFAARLSVQRPPRSRTQIEVSFIDPDRQAAAAAVAALMQAYEQSAELALQDQQMKQLQVTLEHRTRLREHLADIEQQIVTEQRRFGAIPFDQVYSGRLAELDKIEAQLSETRLALSALHNDLLDYDEGRALSPEAMTQLARADTTVNQLWLRKQTMEFLLEKLGDRMGDNSPAIQGLKQNLGRVTEQLNDAVRHAEVFHVRLVGMDVEGSIPMTVEDLDRRQQQLTGASDKVRREIESLANYKAQLADLHTEADGVRRQIDAVQFELDHLVLAPPVRGRVQIVSRGDVSHQPFEDLRPQRAGWGGGVGLVVFAGLAMLFAGLDSRMRHPDAVALAQADAPLFGAVPRVDPHRTDAHEADLTALAIHEIRALLEVRAHTDNCRAFAITSPSPRAGKTSLTVGLASSLAMSGARTLLIDCELTGRMEKAARRRDADDPDQRTQQVTQSLDRVMVEMGFLDSRAADMFDVEGDAQLGLVGMLGGKPLQACAIKTNLPGLWMLPALSAKANHIGRMSSKFIRGVIHEARRRFDLILFDTGPIPGSVESLFVTSEVDGVVLVVSRGERQQRFDRAVAQLRLARAKLIGTVFNRAAMSDLTLEVGDELAERRRAKKGELDAVPARPRLPRRATMGSGLFAAAVQAQADVRKGPDTPTPRPAAGEHTEESRKGAMAAVADAASDPDADDEDAESPPSIVDLTNASDIKLEDTGSISSILEEDDAQAPAADESDGMYPAPEAAADDEHSAEDDDLISNPVVTSVKSSAIPLLIDEDDPLVDGVFDRVVDDAIANAVSRRAVKGPPNAGPRPDQPKRADQPPGDVSSQDDQSGEDSSTSSEGGR